MRYADVTAGQRVQITGVIRPRPTRGGDRGTVVGKEIVEIRGNPVERVWIDTDNGGRRISVPDVLVSEAQA
jgi:hypothetical protein